MRLPFIPYDREMTFHQTERRLPHRDQPGRTDFVTWRLADSVPLDLINQWRSERDLFLAAHPKPWSDEMHRQYDREFERRLERSADEGHGACHLQVDELR